MNTIKQLSRLLGVAGITLLVLSFMFSPGVSMTAGLSPHTPYEAQFFLITDNMYIHVNTKYDYGNFSLYILSYENMLQFLESETLEGIDPLFTLENASEYEGMIYFPTQGVYGSFLTCPTNTTVIIQGMMIARPRLSFIFTGLVMISPMAIIIIYWLFTEKLKIWEFKNSPKS